MSESPRPRRPKSPTAALDDDGFPPTVLLSAGELPAADDAAPRIELDWAAIASASPVPPPPPPDASGSLSGRIQGIPTVWWLVALTAFLVVSTFGALLYLKGETESARFERSVGVAPTPATVSEAKLSAMSNQELLAAVPELLNGRSLPDSPQVASQPTVPVAPVPPVAQVAQVASTAVTPAQAPPPRHPLDGTRLDLKLAPLTLPRPAPGP